MHFRKHCSFVSLQDLLFVAVKYSLFLLLSRVTIPLQINPFSQQEKNNFVVMLVFCILLSK